MRNRIGLLVVLMAASVAGGAYAQSGNSGERPGFQRRDGGERLSGEERQRLREDLRRQHNPGGGQQDGAQQGSDTRSGRYAEWQRLSPQQREDVRRDMRNANRNLDRRRH